MAVPILLDCDPGHDDAIAILLAAGHPAIDLRAITTVAGNGPLDKVTRNAPRRGHARRARRRPDRRRRGAAARRAGVAADVHGESALDGPPLPEPVVPLDPRARPALITAARASRTRSSPPAR